LSERGKLCVDSCPDVLVLASGVRVSFPRKAQFRRPIFCLTSVSELEILAVAPSP